MSTTSATSSLPNWVLLNAHAYLGKHKNATIASGSTRNGQLIELSLCPARPPSPSNLFVHCPDMDLTGYLPRIVRGVEDLILLRVAIGSSTMLDDCDYFIYRAAGTITNGGGGPPSLMLLSRPHPFFHDDDVGLLSRGNHYTIAALSATFRRGEYDLHVLHSETTETWICRKLSIEEPQRGFPLKVPRNCSRLLHHDTSTVIAIGGEGGTMCWVDLWRSILLCDVLREDPRLHELPLPLPIELVSCNNGLGVEIGCPKHLRGIAFIKTGDSTGFLKLVHLEPDAISLLPHEYDEAGFLSPSFLMRDWAITVWSNTKMTSSWKDWHRDCKVQASQLTVSSEMHSQLLQSGLLLQEPQDGDEKAAAAGRAVHNLLVTEPIPGGISSAAEDVVYLMARVKYLHSKAWVLALDMRNNMLVGAAEFGTEREPGSRVKYCPGSISNYIMDLESSQGDNLRMLRNLLLEDSVNVMPEAED